jgi:hypothetical protein
MTLTTPMSPSATAMIRSDHAMVLTLFHKIAPDAPPSVCAAAIRTLCTALDVHAQVEEELFYPALRGAGIDLPVLAKSEPEHQRMRELMRPLCDGTLQGQPEEQRRAVSQLMNAVMHHMADEETQLLPEAERRLDHPQLCELGARMTRRKLALARPHAGELAVDLARAAPAKTAVIALTAVVLTAWLVATLRGGRWHLPDYARLMHRHAHHG